LVNRGMAVLLSYSFKSLLARKITTIFTAIGIALVVFVFADVLMLAHGIRKTLVDTGSDENAIVIRRSSGSEINSSIDYKQAGIIETQPEIAMGQNGNSLVSKEVVTVIALRKKITGAATNVTIRGTTELSVLLRPQIKLRSGRLWRKGFQEVIIGSSVAKNFSGTEIGSILYFAGRDWKVTGIFDAGKSGFDSEIWGDVVQISAAFRRPVYSSITMKLRSPSDFEKLKKILESDPRLTVEVKRERVYYAEQSEIMANFLRIIGLAITFIFSLGAMLGAMITMYGAVATRTTEIGTLRALGFQRSSILLVFLTESLLLSFIGGVIGLVVASFMQFITVSTMNWQTFSELAFSFTLTPEIAIQSLIFAIIMGLIGGFLPAIRASRIDIIQALRST